MIIFFSGTGNSEYAARHLSTLLGDQNVIHLKGPALLEAKIEATATGRIVWVCPVYSWGLPPVIDRFISRVQIKGAESASHHLVVTCGDDIGDAHLQWRSIIQKRGWKDVSAWSLTMPNTYTLMKGFDVDPSSVEKSKLEAAPGRLARIASGIKSSRAVNDVVRGKWARVKSRVIYPWFKRFAMSPRPFHHTDGCTSCGLCWRQCPMDNIRPGDDRRPTWGNRCALCLRCYHICPSGAVQYGRATAGKGRYLCPLKK